MFSDSNFHFQLLLQVWVQLSGLCRPKVLETLPRQIHTRGISSAPICACPVQHTSRQLAVEIGPYLALPAIKSSAPQPTRSRSGKSTASIATFSGPSSATIHRWRAVSASRYRSFPYFFALGTLLIRPEVPKRRPRRCRQHGPGDEAGRAIAVTNSNGDGFDAGRVTSTSTRATRR